MPRGLTLRAEVMERQNIRSGAQPIENPLLLLVSAPYFFLQDEYLIFCALELSPS
jgi:hypothetical protein